MFFFFPFFLLFFLLLFSGYKNRANRCWFSDLSQQHLTSGSYVFRHVQVTLEWYAFVRFISYLMKVLLGFTFYRWTAFGQIAQFSPGLLAALLISCVFGFTIGTAVFYLQVFSANK